MKKLVAVSALCLLTACSGGSGFLSKANPFNWFGNKQEVTETEDRVIVAGRLLVAEVKDVSANPVKSGAILNAVGVSERQGFYDGELIALNNGAPNEDGILEFEFRVKEPSETTAVNTERSREIMVATFVSNQLLNTIRGLRVIARTNSRTIRR